ncbi:MAG: hypothetical protein LC792_26030 [Actinobacteria bacterium]|nr:hypothetical protein [Actinomycetota bacterium]
MKLGEDQGVRENGGSSLPALRLGGRIVILRRPLERLLDGQAPDVEPSVVPSSWRAS